MLNAAANFSGIKLADLVNVVNGPICTTGNFSGTLSTATVACTVLRIRVHLVGFRRYTISVISSLFRIMEK